MDIKQLRYFIAIAEEKNITAAAKRLHMSQPPLSMQLKQLEEELGVRLIERNGKRMELTDKGNVLYQHALHLVNQMEEVKNELKETEEGHKGTLAVGINTLSVPGLSNMLEVFHKRYPFVSLKIVQNDSYYLSDMVRNRAIELGFVRLPLEHRGLVYRHILSEPFVFVSRKPMNNISLEEIADLPLILPSTEGLGSYNIIRDTFSKKNLKLEVVAECSDMHVLMEMVSAGIGSTIVPQSVIEMIGKNDLYSIGINDGQMVSSLGIIFLEHHFISSAANHFLSLVEERMKEADPT